MKLLREDISQEAQIIITEGIDKPKKYYIKGIMLQAECINGNGRNYRKPIMEKAVDEYQKLISLKRSSGELGHRNSPAIDPERISHVIESLSWNGNDVVGKARICTHLPMGVIAKGLIDEGIPFGVSSRGLGSIEEQNGIKYVNEFTINCIDLVLQPSAPNAWVNGVMEEAEWIYHATTNSWVLAEQYKNNYKKMNVRQIKENSIKDFSNFINSLK